jgi:protein involved in sex pheromone biosynthesis
MSHRPALALIPFALALTACGPQSPEAKQADLIRDQADNQADQIEAAASNEVARMEEQAATLSNQAGSSQGFDAQRMNVRADALKREAELVHKQAQARAKAVRDQGQAQASAVLAK